MFISIAVMFCERGCKKEVWGLMDKGIDAPSVVHGSPLPYVLGGREETYFLMGRLRAGAFADTLSAHIRDDWGEVSGTSSFYPLVMGARLVQSHARFMSLEGATPEDVCAYIADNIRILTELKAMGIADSDDVANAFSLLRTYKPAIIESRAEKPCVDVEIKAGGGFFRELYEISVHAPDGHHFSPLSAAAVLHEAIGSCAGVGRRNEYRYSPRRTPLPLTVVQYESRNGERKDVGRLRLRISDNSVRTKGANSSIVIPAPAFPSFTEGVRRLDDILRAA